MAAAPCPVCDGVPEPCFSARVLRRHEVEFFLCRACGLLRSEEPYWLEEAYRTPLAEADTWAVARTLAASRRLAAVLTAFFDPGAAYLDLAAGSGMLVRRMRDQGFDFYWDDPHAENLFARGFERREAPGAFEVVTAFEVLEHLYDPVPFLEAALAASRTGTLVFSTQLYQGEPPAPDAWPYYAFPWGQHVAFYRRDTLARLAARLGVRYLGRRDLHVFTRQPLSATRFRLATHPLGTWALAAWSGLRRRSLTAADAARLAARASAGSEDPGRPAARPPAG